MTTPDTAWSQTAPGATSETGTLITRRPASTFGRTTTDARRTTRQFGTCVIARSPKLAQQVVEAPVVTPNYSKMLNRLAADDCLGEGELRVPWLLMRTALFEALYVDQFGRGGPTDFKAVPSINHLAGYTGEIPGWAGNVIALARFGECLSRADPANARALLMNLPGSASENQSFAALTPRLGGCVLKGEKLTFSRSVIRGAVAEGMYRLSRATNHRAEAAGATR